MLQSYKKYFMLGTPLMLYKVIAQLKNVNSTNNVFRAWEDKEKRPK